MDHILWVVFVADLKRFDGLLGKGTIGITNSLRDELLIDGDPVRFLLMNKHHLIVDRIALGISNCFCESSSLGMLVVFEVGIVCLHVIHERVGHIHCDDGLFAVASDNSLHCSRFVDVDSREESLSLRNVAELSVVPGPDDTRQLAGLNNNIMSVAAATGERANTAVV